MDHIDEGSTYSGQFAISPGREILGELTFAGPNTELYLQDKDSFNAFIAEQYILGILLDRTRVSLINCFPTEGTGFVVRGNEAYNCAKFFANYIILGTRHLAPDEKVIRAVNFLLPDSGALFYDFDAFNAVLEPEQVIDQVLAANSAAVGRSIVAGPYPQVLYFTGRAQIFSAPTSLGQVSANHRFSQNWVGPNGIGIKNRIWITITFGELLSFSEAFRRAADLGDFLGFILGKPQYFERLELQVDSAESRPILVQVYLSMLPKADPSTLERTPHPADVLLDAVRRPEEFVTVLRNWFDGKADRRDARLRFFSSMRERSYSIDRSIGCANMFDIPSKFGCAEDG